MLIEGLINFPSGGCSRCLLSAIWPFVFWWEPPLPVWGPLSAPRSGPRAWRASSWGLCSRGLLPWLLCQVPWPPVLFLSLSGLPRALGIFTQALGPCRPHLHGRPECSRGGQAEHFPLCLRVILEDAGYPSSPSTTVYINKAPPQARLKKSVGDPEGFTGYRGRWGREMLPKGDSPEVRWRQRRELRPGSSYNKPSMNQSSSGPNAQHLGVPVGPIVQMGTQGFRLLVHLVNMGSPGLAAPEIGPLK